MSDQTSRPKSVGETIIVNETRHGKYQVEVTSASATFVVDEPASMGGLGSGPNPYDLLSAALGSCTVMTVRLYADFKSLPLEHVSARITHHRPDLQARDVFVREVILKGPLDEAQREKLLDIAEHCPVHKTLSRGSDIHTSLLETSEGTGTPSTAGEHVKTMQEAAQSVGEA